MPEESLSLYKMVKAENAGIVSYNIDGYENKDINSLRLSDFNKRKESAGANKFDVMNYMKKQQTAKKKEENDNPMADLLKDFFG